MHTDLQRFLDELRSRLSIVDVVSDKVKLTRKGREYIGLCPFHNEKTPSFTVNEAKGFYHCFGCGAHGDIIRFEMEANGLPFMGAVEKLAHKAGLTIPQFSKENSIEHQKRQSLFEIMDLATSFYQKSLRMPVGIKGLEYLYHRGLTDDLIEKFRLGFAPSSNDLKAYLLSKGANEFDLAELGLIVTPQDKSKTNTHDFFRNRVMIPIFDKMGRPVAFGGRIMDDGQPKYLNSPETPLFNKRRMLYNSHFAKESAYQNKRLIICEGYMDVIALEKFGFSYAMAPMGTALTEDQVVEAWKMVYEPVLCFDGDNAGIKAAFRSIDRVLPILKPGYSLQFMFLPDKMDPDEFLRAKGATEFEKLFSHTVPLIDLLWDKHTKNQLSDTPERKALIEKNIKNEIGKITDSQVRSYYAQEIKKRLAEAYGFSSQSKTNIAKRKKIHQKPVLNDLDLRFILAALIVFPKLIEIWQEKLMMFDFSKFQFHRLLSHILTLPLEELADSNFATQLVEAGFDRDIQNLWEINMIKSQSTDEPSIQKQIQSLFTGVQIKQLQYDLNEAKLKIAKQNASKEDYDNYLTIQSELNALIEQSE